MSEKVTPGGGGEGDHAGVTGIFVVIVTKSLPGGSGLTTTDHSWVVLLIPGGRWGSLVRKMRGRAQATLCTTRVV